MAPQLGKMAPAPTARQRASEVAGMRYWESTLPRCPLPCRHSDGCLVFKDFPDFRPSLTPEEVLRAGAFGGGYFRSIRSSVTKKTYRDTVHEEFPEEWFKGLDISNYITSALYRSSVNEYEAKSGNSLDHWEARGWMRPQDPYGWFQWYCRFFLGRRTLDDARQIGRWVSAIGEKGRWRTYLVGQCVKLKKAWDDPVASPVTRQTLLHWAFRITKAEFDRLAPAIRAGKSVIYMGVVARPKSGPVSGLPKKRPASATQSISRPTKRRKAA